jgi:hypothetical protein
MFSEYMHISLSSSLSSCLVDDDMDEEEAIDEVSVHLRSYFPQTWMWDIVDVEPSGLVR